MNMYRNCFSKLGCASPITFQNQVWMMEELKNGNAKISCLFYNNGSWTLSEKVFEGGGTSSEVEYSDLLATGSGVYFVLNKQIEGKVSVHKCNLELANINIFSTSASQEFAYVCGASSAYLTYGNNIYLGCPVKECFLKVNFDSLQLSIGKQIVPRSIGADINYPEGADLAPNALFYANGAIYTTYGYGSTSKYLFRQDKNNWDSIEHISMHVEGTVFSKFDNVLSEDSICYDNKIFNCLKGDCLNRLHLDTGRWKTVLKGNRLSCVGVVKDKILMLHDSTGYHGYDMDRDTLLKFPVTMFNDESGERIFVRSIANLAHDTVFIFEGSKDETVYYSVIPNEKLFAQDTRIVDYTIKKVFNSLSFFD